MKEMVNCVLVVMSVFVCQCPGISVYSGYHGLVCDFGISCLYSLVYYTVRALIIYLIF